MLGRLLQVRPGEGRRTVLLFTYLFLVISGYVITKSLRDALFLKRYGAASLPYADKLPKPETLVSNAYGFAEQLLTAQRKFAKDVLQMTAPRSGNGDKA